MRNRHQLRPRLNPTAAQRRQILDSLPYPYPSEHEWAASIRAGFTTNGPNAPWPLYNSAVWVGFVYHGGEGELAWPPYSYPLHDWHHWIQGRLRETGVGTLIAEGCLPEDTVIHINAVGIFRWTNAQLRDYQARAIDLLHPDLTLQDASSFVAPVWWAVRSAFGWRAWIS